jgi:O-antigen ligase
MKNKIFEKFIYLLVLLTAITPLVYQQKLFYSFESEKGLFFRFVIEIAFGLWIILIIKNPSFRPKKSLINLSIFIFMSILIIVNLSGQDPQLSIFSNFERMAGLMLYFLVFAYYFIVSTIINTPKKWLFFAISLTVVAFIESFFGILKNINHPEYGGRIIGTLGNPNQLAIYLLLPIFIVIIIYKNWITTNFKQEIFTKYILSFVFIIFLLIYFICLIKTATRGVFIGLIVSFISIFLLITLSKRQFFKNELLAASLILVAILFLFYYKNSTYVQQNSNLARLTHLVNSDGYNTFKARIENYKIAIDGIKERPILGWGQETFHYTFAKHYNPKMYQDKIWYDRVHNIFLDWLVSAGTIGMLSYLFLWMTIIIQLWQKNSSLNTSTKILISGFLVAYFISLLTFFDSLITLLAFMTIAGYIQFCSTKIDKNSSRYHLKLNKNILYFFVAIGTLFTMYFTIFKSYKINRAIANAYNENNIDEVVNIYYNAYKETNFNSLDVAEQFGNLTEDIFKSSLSLNSKQNYFQKTKEVLKFELARRPYNVNLQILMGNLLDANGNTIEAETVFEKVKSQAPNRQENLLKLAMIYAQNNKIDKAIETIQATFQLDTNYEDLKVRQAVFCAMKGDTTLRSFLIEKLTQKTLNNNIALVQTAYGITNQNDEFYKLCIKKFIGCNTTLPIAYYTWANTAFQTNNFKQASIAVYAFRRHYADENKFVDKRGAEKISKDVLMGKNPEMAFVFQENN